MRNRFLGGITLIILGGFAGVLTMKWTSGQAPPLDLPPDLRAPEAKSPPLIRPVAGTGAPVSKAPIAGTSKPKRPAPFDRFRNLEALPELTKQMVIGAQTGMEWLNRYNQLNGLFLPGYNPALNLPMDDDNFLNQAMATFVLARAARFTGDERYTVRANQAVLALLSSTMVDPAAPGIRRTAQQSVICNRLASAGYLVMAIHELPEPADDLLVKGEELCGYIRSRQRHDGSLNDIDISAESQATVDSGGVNPHSGLALYSIALSQKAKPAAWKTEMLRKSLAHYRKWFKDHPQPNFIPWMTAACAECYLSTKEIGYAEFAFEMNDWLCSLQYEQSPDPRRPLWRGGFKTLSGAKVETGAPGIEAALYAQSLADCCRFVRQMPAPDVQRYDRYRTGLIRSLQFLTTLQYTDSNSLHIAANYRLMLVGGFHPTQMDGNLRIEQSAACVSAFIQFLSSGATRSQ